MTVLPVAVFSAFAFFATKNKQKLKLDFTRAIYVKLNILGCYKYYRATVCVTAKQCILRKPSASVRSSHQQLHAFRSQWLSHARQGWNDQDTSHAVVSTSQCLTRAQHEAQRCLSSYLIRRETSLRHYFLTQI